MLYHEKKAPNLTHEQTRVSLLGIVQGDWLHFANAVDRINFTRAFQGMRFDQKDSTLGRDTTPLYSVKLPPDMRHDIIGVSHLTVSEQPEKFEVKSALETQRYRKTFSHNADKLLDKAVGIYWVQGRNEGGMVAFARKNDADRFQREMTQEFPQISTIQESLPPTKENVAYHGVTLPLGFTRNTVFPFIDSARRFGIHGQRLETIMREEDIVGETIAQSAKGAARQHGR